MAQTMRAMDAVSGAMAECFITIEGKRYRFMQLVDFESSIKKTKSEVPILGRSGKGFKTTGWSGSFKGTAHYNQSIIRELLLRYKKTGEDVPFDIQVTNDDPSSGVGRQTVIHKNCTVNGGILSKFNAKSEYLEESIEGTFDDFEIPEKFGMLAGMV